MGETESGMMPTISTDPAEITVTREKREMRIRWQDGHESVYSFDLLRKECPCALCNDQRSKPPAPAGLTLAVLSGPVVRSGEMTVAAPTRILKTRSRSVSCTNKTASPMQVVANVSTASCWISSSCS